MIDFSKVKSLVIPEGNVMEIATAQGRVLWSRFSSYTITFDSNNGTGANTTQTVVGIDDSPASANLAANTFVHPTTGYYLKGWNTKADGSGITYANGQLINITSDITLYAQWSNIYTMTVHHSDYSGLMRPDDTGPMEHYALYIEGEEQPDMGQFSNNSPRVYNLPYGTNVGVIAQSEDGANNPLSYISWNGVKITESTKDARYGFTITSNIDVHFEHHLALENIIFTYSVWICHITTS